MWVYTVSNTTNAVSVINNNARNLVSYLSYSTTTRTVFISPSVLGLPAMFKAGLLRGLAGCAGWCPAQGSVSLYFIYSNSFIYSFKSVYFI